MCSITLMTINVHVHLLFLINILDIYDIANVLYYFDSFCRCLLDHASAFFAFMVLISVIKLGWLIYLVVCPNEGMSGRLVNTCSMGYNNCKCYIDTHLTLPALSCTSQTLSKIFLKILELGIYFESKVSLGYDFLLKPCFLF